MLPQYLAERMAKRMGNLAGKEVQAGPRELAKVPTLRNIQVFPL
jgi:hypothetical protein